jgi:hypothetical protein
VLASCSASFAEIILLLVAEVLFNAVANLIHFIFVIIFKKKELHWLNL